MSVAHQAAWALVGAGGQQAIRFVVLIILARILTPAEFGVVAAAQIIFSLAETFVDFGIGVGLLQSKEVDKATERSAMTVVLASSAAIAMLFVVASKPLAAFLGIPEVEQVLPWIALAFLLQGATGPVIQLMFRAGRFREVSIVQLLSNGLGYSLVAVTLALLGWGYWSLVAGMLAGALLQFVLSFALRPVWPTLRPDWARLRPIVRFGIGVLAAAMLSNLARKGDNWVAGRFLGAASLGFYSRAYSLMDLANELPGVIMTRVMIPHFARASHVEGGEAEAVRQFYLTHVAAAVLTLPAAIATVILAPDIVAILLGDGWEKAAPILAILGAGIFLRLGYKVSGVVALAYGHSGRSAAQQGIYAGLVIAGSILGVRYGLEGIACAVVFALIWQYWAQTGLALQSIAGSWAALAAAMVPVLLAATAAAGGGIAANVLLGPDSSPWVRLAAIGLAIALPYCGCLWLLRRTPQIAALARLSKKFLPDRWSRGR